MFMSPESQCSSGPGGFLLQASLILLSSTLSLCELSTTPWSWLTQETPKALAVHSQNTQHTHKSLGHAQSQPFTSHCPDSACRTHRAAGPQETPPWVWHLPCVALSWLQRAQQCCFHQHESARGLSWAATESSGSWTKGQRQVIGNRIRHPSIGTSRLQRLNSTERTHSFSRPGPY